MPQRHLRKPLGLAVLGIAAILLMVGLSPWVAAGSDLRQSSGTGCVTQIGRAVPCADQTAITTVVPLPLSTNICNEGTVDIAIHDVTNLYGYQFKVTYDGTLLSAAAVFDNTWFDPDAHGFDGPGGWNAACNDAAGVCQFARTRGYPDGPLTGSGVVASIHFSSNLPTLPSNAAIAVTDIVLSDRDGFTITPVTGESVNLAVCGADSLSLCPEADPNVGNLWTEAIGTGQVGRTRKLTVPNHAEVASLYGQLAAVDVGVMNAVRFRYPDNTYVQKGAPTSPAFRKYAVNWWGSDLTPSRYIKSQFIWGPRGNRSPRAFVLWPTYRTDEVYANAFAVFDESIDNHVYRAVANGWKDTVSQTVAIPETQAPGADILVQVALVDNDNDRRPVILTVAAGGVSRQVIAYGPNRKKILNLESVLLENVPAGTDEVVITLHSPDISSLYPFGGDSVAMIGAAVSYACEAAVESLR